MNGIWESTIYELIRRTSFDLPSDIEQALAKAALGSEKKGSNARRAIEVMLDNAAMARRKQHPLCQDTGTLLFYVTSPPGFDETNFRRTVEAAVVKATADGLLRQNAVDPVTGKNSGNNLGAGSPVLHFLQEERENIHVSLILKGGGCENVGRQYALPCAELAADRDLEGVRKCLLDVVYRAQGTGCAPGILGVCIGGDRASGYAESKKQFLRRIGERSATPELAALERRILREANELGIGPMGFGGQTTLFDIFIGSLHRVPASYFVSVSYMCWAYRRHGLKAAADGNIEAWDFPEYNKN